MKDYYVNLALAASSLLLIGLVSMGLLWRRSASAKQLICAVVFLAVFLIGLVPFLPSSVRPSSPILNPKAEVVLVEASSDLVFLPSKNVPQQPDYLLFGVIGIAVGSLLFSFRLAGSLLTGAQMRKSAVSASSRLRGFTKRKVQVVQSLSSPIAIGGFKPIILLPAEAEDWPEDQLRAVLIHEEAHLKNGDPNWQMLAEIVCLIHWFNPLVWILRRIMRQEAEKAADDAVVRAGISPSIYAESLVTFARQMGQDRHSYAWTAFAAKSGIHTRVQAILTINIERKPMKRTTKLTALVSAILTTYVASAFAFPGETPVVTPKTEQLTTPKRATLAKTETPRFETKTKGWVRTTKPIIQTLQSKDGTVIRTRIPAGKAMTNGKEISVENKDVEVIFKVSQAEYKEMKKQKQKQDTVIFRIVDLIYVPEEPAEAQRVVNTYPFAHLLSKAQYDALRKTKGGN